MTESYLERITEALIKDAGLPTPIREFRLCEDRKWRGDFVWALTDDRKVLLEVEGAVWSNGRHTRGSGFIKDCEKYNECAIRGFTVIRVTAEHVKNGQMIEWVKRALGV